MKKFPKCKICNSSDWKFIYKGDIRNGSYGNFVIGEIKECNICKVQKLNVISVNEKNEINEEEFDDVSFVPMLPGISEDGNEL